MLIKTQIRFMFNKFAQKGLSLIEVIVAATVLVIGLGALLTSAVGLFSDTLQSSDYLVATNLAREAVEVIRNKRDDNFLIGNVWNNGFDFDRVILKLTLDANDVLNDFTVVNETDTMSQCVVNRGCQLWFDVDSGLYGDLASAGSLPGARRTKFFRLVEITPRLCNANMSGNNLCVLGVQIGATLKSRVQWYHGTKLREVFIETDLYDWY